MHLDDGPQEAVDAETLEEVREFFAAAIRNTLVQMLRFNMKTFTFRYDPKATLKSTMDQMMKAAKSGKPHIEKNEMRSASLKALLAVATENRLQLFQLIHENKPASVYDWRNLLIGT